MGKNGVNKRRLIVRLVLVALLIGLGFLMYDIGKEYSILIDNETVEIDGREYPTIVYGSLVIDGNEKDAADIWEDDRVLRKLTGVSHTLSVRTLDEDDDSVLATVERQVRLDFDARAMMISLPAIAGGAENILIPNPSYTGEPESIPDETAETETDGMMPGADEPPSF
jgi:hypothetical protein